MGKYEGYLLCTDYDGTLACLGGQVSSENSSAIEYFKSEGGLFTVASGRKPDFILERCAGLLPNAPIIAINGGVITDACGKEILSRSTLKNGIIEVIDTLVDVTGFNGLIEMWAGDVIKSYSWSGDCGKLPSEVFSESESIRYKTVFFHDSVEEAVRMRDEGRQRFGSCFTFERSWPVGLEILPVDGGKGAALRKLRSLCGNAVKTVIGVGDFENDVSLVREADIGYAVGNAVDDVKRVADRITVRNTEHAIRQIIQEII